VVNARNEESKWARGTVGCPTCVHNAASQPASSCRSHIKHTCKVSSDVNRLSCPSTIFHHNRLYCSNAIQMAKSECALTFIM
jgi:hypothetical protein